MTARLYVEGFPPSLSDCELAALFSTFGTVLYVIVAKTIGHETIPFAELEMSSREEAARAVQALHRTIIDKQAILVTHAKWVDEAPGQNTAA